MPGLRSSSKHRKQLLIGSVEAHWQPTNPGLCARILAANKDPRPPPKIIKMQAFEGWLQVVRLTYAAESPQHNDLLQERRGPRSCTKPAAHERTILSYTDIYLTGCETHLWEPGKREASHTSPLSAFGSPEPSTAARTHLKCQLPRTLTGLRQVHNQLVTCIWALQVSHPLLAAESGKQMTLIARSSTVLGSG